MKELRLVSMTFVTECPHCNSINYYQDHSFQDLSKRDIDGIKCWKCNQESVYATSISMEKFMLDNPNDFNPDEASFYIRNGDEKCPPPILD